MARISNMFFLVAILVAALLKSSAAQTTHVVGDTLGWTVPASGASAYTTWAANKTFNIGDILVFNFAIGAHDAAEVRKAEFDACNPANPISLLTTSPANVTINSSGEHYFICTFTGHCSGGQKLAINVSSSSGPSPAPQPAVPSPAPQTSPPTTTPTPAPAPQSTSPTPTTAPAPQSSSPTPTSAPAPQPSSPTPTSAPSPSPPSPSAPSAPSPATPPSPPGNSGTSLGVTCLTLVSIVLAILY
ncbi:putative Cucumber peeling cupredoxin [Tripterygium wilfordii]|uniref:Putative Cucumber peeling cupredoxin n=1 Tax=Tripterygium wilfordii TaxID=458696 RepID=A0A7J7D6X9_TRIWF|nr:cucumber peeling cupredoxin-like [Tripterygium wilfordii]KAF5741999.1 putative Cucumber peeling cupredoxin [Tripterygium wilfordii]